LNLIKKIVYHSAQREVLDWLEAHEFRAAIEVGEAHSCYPAFAAVMRMNVRRTVIVRKHVNGGARGFGIEDSALGS
jgi:hypothetical protein